MKAVSVVAAEGNMVEESVTLEDLDASIGNSPDVAENEIATRYYSDEALLTAIRLRRNSHTTD